jgi:hypothetical protein
MLNVRQEPVPGDWTCAAGLDDYMRENGFKVVEYDKPQSLVVFFGKNIIIPNPPRHRHILRIHDLHHVVTGYGTCHVGEGELAMWEWRAGVLGLGPWAVFLTIITGFIGFVYAPGRMLRAWRDSKGARPLWALPMAYEEMLCATVAELRAQARTPPKGLAREERRLHKNAPSAPTDFSATAANAR